MTLTSLKNYILVPQYINSIEELTFHLFNIYFIFLIFFSIFFIIFDKKLLIKFLNFILKYIKVIALIIYIFFIGTTDCDSKIKPKKKRLNLVKIKKKKLKYSLKKNSIFLKTILELKQIKKVLIRQKNFIKLNLKNLKIPDSFYRSWWDLLITGKQTFSTTFLLNQNLINLEKNIQNKEKLLYNLYEKYNSYYRNKIENYFYKHFKNLDQYSTNKLEKKIYNFKKNTFKKNTFLKKNTSYIEINKNIKVQFKVIKDIFKEKDRKTRAFNWLREYIFKNQKFLHNSFFKEKKIKSEIKWVNPNHPVMRNNIIDFIKFYSIRFYITFLLYFGPIVYPLEFFYSNHKYPILIFLIAIFLLLRYNLSFSNFIKKYDTIKIPLLKKKYNLDDYVSFSMFFFFFLVYLWYFTINITLSIQMLYLTAFMFISGKLFIYLRYQKNPSKYK